VNRYGEQALRHWRAYLPASYGRLEDPVRFFTDLGEQADAETEDRYLKYAGPDVPGESAEDKQARLTWAMDRARMPRCWSLPAAGCRDAPLAWPPEPLESRSAAATWQLLLPPTLGGPVLAKTAPGCRQGGVRCAFRVASVLSGRVRRLEGPSAR
jgi:hypothetical protein